MSILYSGCRDRYQNIVREIKFLDGLLNEKLNERLGDDDIGGGLEEISYVEDKLNNFIIERDTLIENRRGDRIERP